jgi:hypothetical protein
MTEPKDITGIGPSKAEDLAENGYESVEDIAQADPDNLSEISGISEDRALEYMVSAGDLLDSDSSESEEPESEEFDLTPEEVSEELEAEDDEDDVPEVEVVEDDAEADEDGAVDEDESEEEVESGPETYVIFVDFDSKLQYDVFHAALMRYHEKVYTSNQPRANALQKCLDGLVSTDGVEYELNEEEINTLHTAVKQCRTDYQGSNLIDHMDALNPVEDQINDQRRECLF